MAVLAGGLGTRLHSVLPDAPKLLAPVEGRPLIDYLLDWFEGFGARRVVLCLGHLAEQVTAHLAGREGAGREGPLEILTSVETEPLGTAGALRLARPLLTGDPVLAVNGDSFVDADLCGFLDAHRRSGAAATILCTEVADAGRFGRVVIGPDRRIRRFVEKDLGHRGSAAISAGVYLFAATFLDRLAAGTARSLEQDVFMAEPAGRLHAFAGRFRFVDIGTPESLSRTRAAMLRPAAAACR